MKFVYEGPVYAFDSLLYTNWKAETYATSKAKAVANLKYRFRKAYNVEMYTPLDLPGKWTTVA